MSEQSHKIVYTWFRVEYGLTGSSMVNRMLLKMIRTRMKLHQ